MSTFHVEVYTLNVMTVAVNAESAAEAVSKAMAGDYQYVEDEMLDHNETEYLFEGDHDDPKWTELFARVQEIDGNNHNIFPAIRGVTDVDSGEEWERYTGYKPPKQD